MAMSKYLWAGNSKKSASSDDKKSTEHFTGMAAGALNNVGMMMDSQYDLLQAPEMDAPTPNFADLVSENRDALNEYIAQQPESTGENLRPIERLTRISGKEMMPRVSTSVTPFNVDVANPTSYKFMVNTPRVDNGALQSRYKDSSMSTYIRGDIPINFNPNVPLVSRSRIGRDAQRLDGLFSPYFDGLYNKYTGKANKNLVMNLAGAGSAAGYGGASSEIIMDYE